MDFPHIMQHSTTTPLPTLLPTEIIEEVIDQASDDRRTLRRLSLLCKSLLTRARFHLFNSIVIRDVEQMESSREFLDSRPWLPPLVQKVTLFAYVPYTQSKPNIPLLDIIRLHLFTQLPNLRAWGMRTEGIWLSTYGYLPLHPTILLCYRLRSGRIQDLELDSLRIEDVFHFVRLISAFTSLERLTCSNITLRKKLEVSLSDPIMLAKFAKPLKIKHLSIDTSVDICLVEYLLGSSVATLKSLAITLVAPPYGPKDPETYFGRLDQLISRLSKPLLSLLLIITCGPGSVWVQNDSPTSVVQRIRRATGILTHVKRTQLSDIRVEFKSNTLVHLGGPLSYGGSSLEACKALETVLLSTSHPTPRVQLLSPEIDRRIGGRPEFWSPAITSAFPRLNERGLLTLPHTSTLDPVGHEVCVFCLVTSPDSKWIATASEDGTIIIWDIECGTLMHEWLAHLGDIEGLAFSPDSRCLLSGCRAHTPGDTLIVWDLSDPTQVRKVAVLASIPNATVVNSMEHGSWPTPTARWRVSSCAWSPDGKYIASVFGDGSIHVWDALSFQQRSLLSSDHAVGDPIGFPKILQWTPDSQRLAWIYSSLNNNSHFYNKWTIWKPLADAAEEPPAKPRQVFSHPTQGSESEDFPIRALSFDLESGRIATAIARNITTEDIGCSEDAFEGLWGSDGSCPGYVQVWDALSGASLAVLGHAKGVCDVSFSPDGRSMLSASVDGLMKIWDTDTWQETASLEGDGDEKRCCIACFSPDGQHISMGMIRSRGDPVELRLWRIGEASCVTVSTQHKDIINRLAFSPNGKFLASGDVLGRVYIHHLSSFI